jgi:colanic acid biosynthesis glycosyl transferase WcaI
MRIVVHDYAGHPFQVQLSRELARRGHAVRHIFSTSFQTPKGNLSRGEGDPDGFELHPVSLPSAFKKDGFLKRREQEIDTGHLVAEAIASFSPDVVISSNAPLDTQHVILKQTRRSGARFIFWLQDVYSEAISRLLPKRLPGIGHIVAPYYWHLESKMLRRSDRIVSITGDFLGPLAGRGVDIERVSVIENWAPLDEMQQYPRDNDWARENLREAGLRVLYSGTLGYKHDSRLLLDIAKAIDGHVYVFSEGSAAERLRREAAEQGHGKLSVRGWVPFTDLPKVLSSADMLIAMIDKDAGAFSVPSKVLSYFCVGRPIVAAIPKGNLARRLIESNEAGIVASPGDTPELLARLRDLAADPARREELGRNGRAYAERTFDIAPIGQRFEDVITASLSSPRVANPA